MCVLDGWELMMQMMMLMMMMHMAWFLHNSIDECFIER